MMNSSLGEFPARLKLLENFTRQIQYMIDSQFDFANGTPSGLMNILKNTVSFFSSFERLLDEFLGAQEKPLVKELNDFMKISSWKDVNAYALKESAKRSHYQLLKFIKKYGAVLDTPARQIITTMLDKNDLKTIQIQFQGKNPLPPKNEKLNIVSADHSLEVSSKRKQKVHSILRKIADISDKLTSKSGLNTSALRFDDLTRTLLEDVNQFKSESLNIKPGSKDASFEKSIRKKALSDWIKELSKLGISKRPSVENQKINDMLFLFSQPHLGTFNTSYLPEHTQSLLEKVDKNFYRILAKKSKIPDSIIKNNGDLSEREISSCLSFLDHLLYGIVRLRSYVSSHAQALEKISMLTAQLGTLSTASAAAVTKATMDDIFYLISNVSKSLKVILQAKVFFQYCKDSTSIDWDGKLQVLSEIIEKFYQKLQNEYPYQIIRSKSLFISPANYDNLNLEFKSILENVIAVLSEKDTSPHSIQETLKALLEIKETIVKGDNSTPVTIRSDATYADEIIDQILLSFQNILKSSENLMDDSELDNYGMYAKEFTAGLYTAEKYADTENLLGILSIAEKAILDSKENDLLMALPFLESLRSASYTKITDMLFFTQKISKLAFVGACIFDTILKDGFCVPEGESKSQEDAGDKEVSGAGLGEGNGEQDISKDIENEGEIEELKSDENNAANELDQKREKNDDAIEAKDDFDGALEDLDDAESAEEDDENGEDVEKELDEQMGDLDDNADVVDEKMWNEDEMERKDEKIEKDAPGTGSADEELVAKMDKQNLDVSNDAEQIEANEQNSKDDAKSEVEENLEDKQTEENNGVDARPDEFSGDDSKDLEDTEDMQIDSDFDLKSDISNDKEEFLDTDSVNNENGLDQDETCSENQNLEGKINAY